jgi:hypothetical protein
VEARVGEFYLHNHELNAITINNIKNTVCPIPGLSIYDFDMDIEEQIFFSHPEMLILPVLLHRRLEDLESIVIHGAEKYSSLEAVNHFTPFNFRQKYRDVSQLNPAHNCKLTAFAFVQRRRKHREQTSQHTMNDILRVLSGVKACECMHSRKKTLISGDFKSVQHKRREIDWDLKFVVDWMAATMARWELLVYFVEGQN